MNRNKYVVFLTTSYLGEVGSFSTCTGEAKKAETFVNNSLKKNNNLKINLLRHVFGPVVGGV